MLGRANFQPVDPGSRPQLLFPRINQTVTGQASEISQCYVGRDGQKEHEPFDAPFTRDVADAKIDRIGRRRQRHVATCDPDTAAVMRHEPCERARQLFATRPDNARDP